MVIFYDLCPMRHREIDSCRFSAASWIAKNAVARFACTAVLSYRIKLDATIHGMPLVNSE